MTLNKATRRYAKTLFDAAMDKNALDSINNDLKNIQSLFDNTAGLRNFFNEPFIQKADEDKMVGFISEALNPTLVKFISLLQKKKRLALLTEIQPSFNELYEKHKGIVRALVTSTKPLSDAQLKKLHNKLKQAFQAKQLLLDTQINRKLIAGFQVQIGDLIINANVKNKLLQLKRKLAA